MEVFAALMSDPLICGGLLGKARGNLKGIVVKCIINQRGWNVDRLAKEGEEWGISTV